MKHVLWQVLGAPMIPCMMMVLGAVLYKGPGSANIPARLIWGVASLRLILIPLLGEKIFRILPVEKSIWRRPTFCLIW